MTLNHVDSVYNLGLILFRDNVARQPAIRNKIRETLLDLVNRERNGEKTDLMAVRSTCHMLVQLGVESLTVYQEDFEKEFLKQSSDFYKVLFFCCFEVS